MARPSAGGWYWDKDEHLEALAHCLREQMRAGQIAGALNAKFRPLFPDMALTKNSIVSAFRNRSVPNLLRAKYPSEAEAWFIEFHRHKPGRGKKGASGGARHGQKRARPQAMKKVPAAFTTGFARIP